MTSISFRLRWIWTVTLIICLCSVHQISFAQTVEEMYQDQNQVDDGESIGDDERGLEGDSPSDSELDGSLLDSQSDSPLKLFATFIFYLVIVIILIYVLIRFLAVRQRKLQNNGVFQSLGGLPLGPNKSLQLVKIGQELYVIGVADQINLIKEIKNEEERDRILQQLAEQDSMMNNRFLTSWPWRKREQQDEHSSFSFQDMFQQSIKQQKESQLHVENKLDSMNTEQREGRS